MEETIEKAIVLAIRDTRGLTAAQKGVLYSLALRSGDAGQCWPSLTTIARDAGVSRATVMRALPKLEQLGHVSRVRRRREGVQASATSLYTLHVQAVAQEIQEVEKTPADLPIAKVQPGTNVTWPR